MLLLTAATGFTTPPLASLCASKGTPYLLAARRPSSLPASLRPHAVEFDFTAPHTWDPIFTAHSITAIYLVLPPIPSAATHVSSFITAAFHHGVKRFVLCAGASAQRGYGPMGEVWDHLAGLGVEYTILKPSWFMDNLLPGSGSVIAMEGRTIYAATGSRGIGFQAAEDVAGAAYVALTKGEGGVGEEVMVNGPEMVGYEEVARKLTDKLGVEYKYVSVGKEELIRRHVAMGKPEAVAGIMAWLEEYTAEGKEEQLPTGAVEKLTGTKGVTLDEFIEKHRAEFGV